MAIANTTKAITQRRTDPYGNARGTATAAWPGDRGFLNKVEDSTGLTQVGARYYEARIGRFVSVDPVFDTSAPQQWGAYSYGDNNPVAYWDPSGLWSIKSAWNSAKKKASSAWKATTRFVNKYQAEIVGGVVGGVVTGACLAASWGVGSVGCAALGGAAAGAATNLWKSKVQKTQKFSWASLARDVGVGAVVGGATAGLQGIASAALRRGASAVAAAAQRGAGAAVSGARAAASEVRGRVAAAAATGADRGSISIGSAGRERAAIAAADSTTAPAVGGGSPRAPGFVVHPNGEAVIVPEGASGPFPTRNGRGVQFTGGAGGRGLESSVSSVRIMDPVTTGQYPYPNGYVSYANSRGQAVNPFNGETVGKASPWWHWGFE
jgi:RHS repeat-associated protein